MKKQQNGLIPKIKTMFLNKEFICFLVIGVINTFNGSILSYFYSSWIQNVNVSFVAGYLTSLVIAYLLNSFFAFKEKLSFKRMFKFMVSYIPNFIIQNIMVVLFYNTLHWHKLVAYMMAAVVGVPVTFILIKVFAFKKKDESFNRPK